MDNYNWKKKFSNTERQGRFSDSRPSHNLNYNYNYNQSSSREYHQNNRNFRNYHDQRRKNYQRDNVCPYKRPRYRSSNTLTNSSGSSYFNNQRGNSEDIMIPLSPLDMKIERLINEIKSQSGINGQIIFIKSQESENSINLLTNAVLSTTFVLNMKLNEESNMYELKVNNEKLAETINNGGKKALKSLLYEIAYNNLKRKCFSIKSKQNFEEVTTGAESTDQTTKKDVEPTSSMEGSKAHLMMLKMGWGGKGLGINEQGEEKTVAEKMTRNITKEGLGNVNIMAEVESILKEFAHSTKVTTLAFDASFTKEERASIHQLAQKFNLKSKSIGKDENRRITISKKVDKWDLVKTLLREEGLENDAYKLLIPEDFKHLWVE